MSVKGKLKEAAGYVEEEAGEAVNANETANKGRDLRNEGRIEDGKLPKVKPVGTEHKTDNN